MGARLCNAKEKVCSRDDHTGPLFVKAGLLKLHNINQYVLAQFMFRFYNNLLPDIFNDMFIFNTAIHNYNTRQNRDLHVPHVRSNITVGYWGVIQWNQTIKHIDIVGSLTSFKRKLKYFILKSQ